MRIECRQFIFIFITSYSFVSSLMHRESFPVDEIKKSRPLLIIKARASSYPFFHYFLAHKLNAQSSSEDNGVFGISESSSLCKTQILWGHLQNIVATFDLNGNLKTLARKRKLLGKVKWKQTESKKRSQSINCPQNKDFSFCVSSSFYSPITSQS